MVEGSDKGFVEELAGQAGDGSVLTPLALAFWRMRGAFEREVGASAGTWFLLELLLGEDGLSQSEVVRRFEVDPSRITRLGQKLESESLLLRRRDPDDNRVVRLYLTDGGRSLLSGLRQRREEFEARVRNALGEEEADELRRMLRELAEAME
jgi:DNA-binding MarR family transcriptional regulator